MGPLCLFGVLAWPSNRTCGGGIKWPFNSRSRTKRSTTIEFLRTSDVHIRRLTANYFANDWPLLMMSHKGTGLLDERRQKATRLFIVNRKSVFYCGKKKLKIVSGFWLLVKHQLAEEDTNQTLLAVVVCRLDANLGNLSVSIFHSRSSNNNGRRSQL